MKPCATALCLTMWLVAASPAAAHPAPFSYVDLKIEASAIEITVVAHIFDIAHDLDVTPQERLLEPAFLRNANPVASLLSPRIRLVADGTRSSPVEWSAAEPLPERQAVRIRGRSSLSTAPGVVALEVLMFPYDPAHQTFVNVYERDSLTLQAILYAGKTRLELYPGSREGAMAVLRRFAPAGARHVFLGIDHVAFLGGLVLLGGSMARIAAFAAALACANLLVLALTILQVMQPPPRLVEPAIGLTIIYLGIDNLMVRGGRDMRVWIASAFGVIHGFWFANGLLAADLPARTLGWSLLSFDTGVELANAITLAALGACIWGIRSRMGVPGKRIGQAGSALVIVAGTYWFIQRVFFAGGLG